MRGVFWARRQDYETIRAIRKAYPELSILPDHGQWVARRVDMFGHLVPGVAPVTGSDARELSAAIMAAWAVPQPPPRRAGRHS